MVTARLSRLVITLGVGGGGGGSVLSATGRNLSVIYIVTHSLISHLSSLITVSRTLLILVIIIIICAPEGRSKEGSID